MKTKKSGSNLALNDAFKKVVAETNGIELNDTLELLQREPILLQNPKALKQLQEFKRLLWGYHQEEVNIKTLIDNQFSSAIISFFSHFPIKYREEHIHLTGSLTADFIYPRLMVQIDGPNGPEIKKIICNVYGEQAWPIKSVEDVDKLIRLNEEDLFDRYLQILTLAKFILIDKKTHIEAAYHLASELYYKYNVGSIRLKFTYSRVNQIENENIPGVQELSSDDVVLGLFEGMMIFKKECPDFNFILSPCFRKEPNFFDSKSFATKEDHFNNQVQSIIKLLNDHPYLRNYLTDVDTVGNEKELYRKDHFQNMKHGFRKLQAQGIQICSHHGETWNSLVQGIQAVDNALNIWRIDHLEHGLSLGINPNYYFHGLFQHILELNAVEQTFNENSRARTEIIQMPWKNDKTILNKLLDGVKLNKSEISQFSQIKSAGALEVESYQHDILNRLIDKKMSLTSLPSSNKKLTDFFPEHKDHPFSWWEKKGMGLRLGTDNYVTLNTNYLQEMLILLYSDPYDLKITKLLMISTGETRRPLLTRLMSQMS